jgi:hypothetical protein
VASGETSSVTIDNSVATTDISITKEWDDDGDADGVRPSTDEFASWLTLEADGETVDGATPVVVDNGDNTFTVTYTDVDAYDSQGDEIVYTIAENIPSEYGYYTASTSSVGDGGVLVNSYESDDSSAAVSDSSTVSRQSKSTTVPDTGDATYFPLVLLLAAGVMITLSQYLKRRAR